MRFLNSLISVVLTCLLFIQVLPSFAQLTENGNQFLSPVSSFQTGALKYDAKDYSVSTLKPATLADREGAKKINIKTVEAGGVSVIRENYDNGELLLTYIFADKTTFKFQVNIAEKDVDTLGLVGTIVNFEIIEGKIEEFIGRYQADMSLLLERLVLSEDTTAVLEAFETYLSSENKKIKDNSGFGVFKRVLLSISLILIYFSSSLGQANGQAAPVDYAKDLTPAVYSMATTGDTQAINQAVTKVILDFEAVGEYLLSGGTPDLSPEAEKLITDNSSLVKYSEFIGILDQYYPYSIDLLNNLENAEQESQVQGLLDVMFKLNDVSGITDLVNKINSGEVQMVSSVTFSGGTFLYAPKGGYLSSPVEYTDESGKTKWVLTDTELKEINKKLQSGLDLNKTFADFLLTNYGTSPVKTYHILEMMKTQESTDKDFEPSKVKECSFRQNVAGNTVIVFDNKDVAEVSSEILAGFTDEFTAIEEDIRAAQWEFADVIDIGVLNDGYAALKGNIKKEFKDVSVDESGLHQELYKLQVKGIIASRVTYFTQINSDGSVAFILKIKAPELAAGSEAGQLSGDYRAIYDSLVAANEFISKQEIFDELKRLQDIYGAEKKKEIKIGKYGEKTDKIELEIDENSRLKVNYIASRLLDLPNNYNPNHFALPDSMSIQLADFAQQYKAAKVTFAISGGADSNVPHSSYKTVVTKIVEAIQNETVDLVEIKKGNLTDREINL